MWAEACAMLDHAERLHRRFFHPTAVIGQVPRWEPPVDLFESDDAIWITVALPGVPRRELEVSVTDGVLVVTGRRTLPDEFRRAAIHRLEIPFGWFERRLRLPAGRFEMARRELEDGCLTLVLRKVA